MVLDSRLRGNDGTKTALFLEWKRAAISRSVSELDTDEHLEQTVRRRVDDGTEGGAEASAQSGDDSRISHIVGATEISIHHVKTEVEREI